MQIVACVVSAVILSKFHAHLGYTDVVPRKLVGATLAMPTAHKEEPKHEDPMAAELQAPLIPCGGQGARQTAP